MDGRDKQLKDFLSSYSLDDLARSFFVLNLWLPNIASPIKVQYLYTVLESIFSKLPKENKIKSFEDFDFFCKKIFNLLPSFPMLEDYVPEADWGEIKYFFHGKFYRIFYGGDLSNTYDFYYSFEIIHSNFEDYYLKTLRSSALQEFEFCLELQDYIIRNLDQSHQKKSDVSPGEISVPSGEFWMAANHFLDHFNPNDMFDEKLLKRYTCDFNSFQSSPWPEKRKFMEQAYEGKNCLYFFIKRDKKYYPVMPRKCFSVLYDTLGKVLKQHYSQIKNEHKNPEVGIGIELFKFIRDRVDWDEVFGLVSPVDQDQKPGKTNFSVAVRSRNKLFLIHVTPPYVNQTELHSYLENLSNGLKESEKLLSTHPTRLLLWAKKQIVEFRSKKKGEKLEPVFFTVVPYCSTELVHFTLPEDLPGEIIGLEQIAGIFDEIEELDDLADFFEYLKDIQSSSSISPMSSYLDIFGSFKDSHGVLLAGALEPDMMVLDPHWGSHFRYQSLSQFWQKFPEVGFFGHPRSWSLPKQGEEMGGIILKSKTFFGYAYYREIGRTSIFINAPVHLMTSDQGKITDLMMQSLFDALKIYQETICHLPFTEEQNKIQVLFSPVSLVREKTDLKHLRHLIPPGQHLWKMDITRIKSKDYGVRIVFDDKKVVSAFQNAKDRSRQINLLVDLLKTIASLLGDQGFANVSEELQREKSKPSRFKTFLVEKKVSFPEFVNTVTPDENALKKADKEIARLGKELGLSPGTYALEDAKKKLEVLIDGVVAKINSEVANYRFQGALPLLIEKVDALTNQYEIKKHLVKQSLDQEVDYEREMRSSEDHKQYLHHHKDYRYLIEKFVQLRPNGTKELNSTGLKYLLALTDRLLDLYAANDILWYRLYSTKITINRDFLVSVSYSVDLKARGEEFGREQAKIDLGMVGNPDDVPIPQIDIVDHLEEIDNAFRMDFEFGIRDLVNVQQILSLWPVYNKEGTESTHYIASVDEIEGICSANIRGVDRSAIKRIVSFLTLKPEELLFITGKEQKEKDLPIWEHRKRTTRYTIKPLIKIGNNYIWGSHSVDCSGRIWANVPHTNKLPADFEASNVEKILEKAHTDIEQSLEMKTEEIAKRFTPFVRRELYPHKLDNSIPDIGDYDVLAFLKDKNILLNIEAKIIDPAFCLKDAKRIQEKIFGRTKIDGSFQKGYLKRVEDRAQYLDKNALRIMEKIAWDLPQKPPKVISVFVTQRDFWWTKFPPVETHVNFIQIKMLEDFITSL